MRDNPSDGAYMPPIRPPHAFHRLVTATLIVALLASCTPAIQGGGGSVRPPIPSGRADDPDPDQQPAGPNEEEVGSRVALIGVRTGKYTGQLTSDVTTYQNGDGPSLFYSLMQGKGWHGWKRNRRCEGTPACLAQTAQTQLIVEAIHDAHKVPVKLDDDIPGVVIGRVMNVGTEQDYTLHLPPAKPQRRPDQVYFVVSHGTDDVARLQVATLTFGADGDPASLTVVDAPRGFTNCWHKKIKRDKGMGDFRSCNAPGGAVRHDGDSDEERTEMLNADIAMAWFSCDLGCCSAQWPP
jgi:hypothetical protein